MEALLIDEWLDDVAGSRRTAVLDEASLSLVRQSVREAGAEAGLSQEIVESVSLVASELGRNQLRHAVGGRIAVRPIARAGVAGLEVVAVDRGLGIQDPASALEGTPRVAGTLGVGLASAVGMATEVDVDVRLGEGTSIRARRFAGEVPRRRQIGVFGRALTGEPRSGDHACYRRVGDVLVVGVCDGLGHGAPARHASSAALRAFHDHVASPPDVILDAVNASLHRTRGAVMAVARVDEAADALEVASVGNVAAQAVGPRAARRFGGSSFVLGTPPQRVRKVQVEVTALARAEALVLFTDGVSSRMAIENDLDLLRQHPVVIAQRIVAEHGRPDDDILVLVAR